MAFKQRPSTYRISKAPTGRGCCRKCRKLIPKGETRVEVCVFVRPGRSTVMLRCTNCIDTRFATAVLSVYERADRVPATSGLEVTEASRVRGTITSAATRSLE